MNSSVGNVESLFTPVARGQSDDSAPPSRTMDVAGSPGKRALFADHLGSELAAAEEETPTADLAPQLDEKSHDDGKDEAETVDARGVALAMPLVREAPFGTPFMWPPESRVEVKRSVLPEVGAAPATAKATSALPSDVGVDVVRAAEREVAPGDPGRTDAAAAPAARGQGRHDATLASVPLATAMTEDEGTLAAASSPAPAPAPALASQAVTLPAPASQAVTLPAPASQAVTLPAPASPTTPAPANVPGPRATARASSAPQPPAAPLTGVRPRTAARAVAPPAASSSPSAATLASPPGAAPALAHASVPSAAPASPHASASVPSAVPSAAPVAASVSAPTTASPSRTAGRAPSARSATVERAAAGPDDDRHAAVEELPTAAALTPFAAPPVMLAAVPPAPTVTAPPAATPLTAAPMTAAAAGESGEAAVRSAEAVGHRRVLAGDAHGALAIEDLGRFEVSARSRDDGRVDVHVRADHRAGAAMLESHAAELRADIRIEVPRAFVEVHTAPNAAHDGSNGAQARSSGRDAGARDERASQQRGERAGALAAESSAPTPDAKASANRRLSRVRIVL
ncbi:MAG TPA: hypothetical protein VLT33_27515 [Labilithrix sp.]|nr:hypothetical protein [Labilithrix sp.]